MFKSFAFCAPEVLHVAATVPEHRAFALIVQPAFYAALFLEHHQLFSIVVLWTVDVLSRLEKLHNGMHLYHVSVISGEIRLRVLRADTRLERTVTPVGRYLLCTVPHSARTLRIIMA